MASKLRPAARYIRMSTDKQDLSPVIQRDAIDAFATANGYEIVASYEDEGRSGVDIAGRPSLRRLLLDVADKPVFCDVLVYDVSRWGRFQDTDAAAYYEYHCRLHGVRVVYVNESFSNDLTPTNVLLKSMRRVMAAEYSRDLAAKARAGQERVISMGYQMGALPPLGYRRRSVSADGKHKLPLVHGQRKAALTDRIEWVLAPEPEVALVRRICQAFASGMPPDHLAKLVRAEGWRTEKGKEITSGTIKVLVRHEALIGNFVWGDERKRGKILKCGPTRLDGSVPRIIDSATWDAMQEHARLRRALRCKRGTASVDPPLTPEVRTFPPKQLHLPFRGAPTRKRLRNSLGTTRQLQLQTREFGRALSAALCTHGLAVSFNANKNILSFWNVSFRLWLMWPCEEELWELGRVRTGLQAEEVLIARMAGLNRPVDFFVVSGERFAEFPRELPARVPVRLHACWCESPEQLIQRLTKIAAAADG